MGGNNKREECHGREMRRRRNRGQRESEGKRFYVNMPKQREYVETT
jgi:hypothetical protein